MNNEELILLSMLIATIVMIGLKYIESLFYKHKYNKMMKRTTQLQELTRNNEIDITIINLDVEPERAVGTMNNKALLIDGEKYDDSTSYFLHKDGRFYVMGIKEDYVIALVGRKVDNLK